MFLPEGVDSSEVEYRVEGAVLVGEVGGVGHSEHARGEVRGAERTVGVNTAGDEREVAPRARTHLEYGVAWNDGQGVDQVTSSYLGFPAPEEQGQDADRALVGSGDALVLIEEGLVDLRKLLRFRVDEVGKAVLKFVRPCARLAAQDAIWAVLSLGCVGSTK